MKLGLTETFDQTENIVDSYLTIVENLEKNAEVSRNVPKQLADHNYDTNSPPPPPPQPEPETKPEKKERTSRAKDIRICKLERRNRLLKNKLAAYESGNVPKTVRKKVVEKALCEKFTPAEIHQILKQRKKIIQSGPRKGKRGITRWAIYPILV